MGTASGRGMIFSHASVTTPSVPSLPTMRWTRSNPALFLASGSPKFATLPLGRTTRRATTQSFTVPYFTQRSPPEPSATAPPTVQSELLAGSGGKKNPSFARRLLSSSRVTPAWARAYQFTVSTFSTASILRMSRIIAPLATAAPVRLVPAPLGTMATFLFPASATIFITSPSEPGLTTTAGRARKPAMSSEYSSRRAASAKTFSAPLILARAPGTSPSPLLARFGKRPTPTRRSRGPRRRRGRPRTPRSP